MTMIEPKARVERVVVILADGARPDLMQSLAARGDLPAISQLFLQRDPSVTIASTVFPSTTGPAHLPFLTGMFPGTCNVPGIRWFDPECYSKHPFSLHRFRSYMGLGGWLLNSDIRRDVKTLFQHIPDHASIANMITRGVRRGRNLTRIDKPLYNIKSFFAEEWAGFDRLAARRAVQAIAAKNQLVYAAFYEADSHCHKFGATHERTMDAYRRIDRIVGDVNRALTQAGTAESTLVALVADHGGSDTSNHFDLAGLVEKTVGRCLAHPLVWHGWWWAKAAVMVSGNAMAHVYLCPRRRLGERPVLDEPTADLRRLVESLLEQDAVDLLAGRSSDGGVFILSRAGKGRIVRQSEGLSYRVEGQDPLDGSGMSSEGRYPDAIAQLAQLMTSPRAGDLVVSARLGWDLRARFEKPKHFGSHGSLIREHMATPFLLNATLKPGPYRTVDLMPTVLDALGQPVPGGLDGRSLWLG